MIRNAESIEITALNALMRRSKAYYGYDESLLDDFMAKYLFTEENFTAKNCRVLESDGELVGLHTLVVNTNYPLELESFYVAPDNIQQGYGKKLWLDVCEEAKGIGHNEFMILAEPQPLAERFYLDRGAEKVEQILSEATQRTAWLFRYEL